VRYEKRKHTLQLKNMHIIFEEKPTSQRGGQELVLYDICHGLAQRGHKITLLYTDQENLLTQYQQFCSQTLKIKQFRIYRPQHILPFISSILELKQNITIYEPKNTIILSNQYQDTFLGRILSLTLNIPLLCYIHLPPPETTPWQWQFQPKKLKHFIAHFNMSNQIKIGLQGVKKFIAVSHQTKMDWVQKGYQSGIINVVHNGINLDKYQPVKDYQQLKKDWNISEDSRVISYVGRLDPEKGIEILLNAFALLQKTSIKTKLLIAGKPVLAGEEYKETLKQLTIDLDIQNHVNFLGHIANTTTLYQVSDVTVLPSQWSEPFPRSTIESMACGTPVVASRTGGIPESLTGEFGKGLFEPGCAEDLAKTLNQIIDWRTTDPQLGMRCRIHAVSKFSIDRMIDDVEKIFQQFNSVISPSNYKTLIKSA
jgi:glycosyltransferase involved in cell wall biosynthesis